MTGRVVRWLEEERTWTLERWQRIGIWWALLIVLCGGIRYWVEVIV